MRILLGFVMLLSLAGRPLLATVAETLTTSEIEDAIRLGRFGEPSPYLVYNPGDSPSARSRALVMAIVYTPFIRVALAAKVARDNGRDFTLADVTGDLTEPVAYVAYRWYCCVDPRVHGEDKTTWDPHRPPFDYRIATDADRQVRIGSPKLPPAPLSVTRDLSPLTRFGDRLPYNDLVLLTMYPIHELARARDFAIYRRASDGQGTWIIPGRVTADDVAGWR